MGERDADLLVLANEAARVVIDLGQGSEIREFRVLEWDLDLVLPGPAGHRRPSGDPDLAFIDGYHGGWQEVFPNGGAPSTYEGVRFGQHDEVWRRRWTVSRRDEISATLTVDTQLVPFRLHKELRLVPGAAHLEVRERATNLGPSRQRVMWGQHLAYGSPFLMPGTTLQLPDGVPLTPHPQPTNPPLRMVDAAPGAWPRLRTPEGAELDLRPLPGAGAPSDIIYAGPFDDPA